MKCEWGKIALQLQNIYQKSSFVASWKVWLGSYEFLKEKEHPVNDRSSK